MPAGQNDRAPEGTPPKPTRIVRLIRLFVESMRIGFARLLRVEDAHKPKIYQSVFAASEIDDLNYWLELIFSMGIATLGLITNSAAVVIGAMLISPLRGPIIASGLAIALGDFYLGIKSTINLVLSLLAAVSLSAFITWILPFHTPTSEILARVQPTSLDLGIAVLSGMAGSIVVCRGGRGGGITALPGVAIAVALMPPICVIGFGVGIGWDGGIIRGAGLLFLTNLVAIIFSAFLVFFSIRMDTPTVREEINSWIEEQEQGERMYEALQRTPLRALFGRVGSFPRRALILSIFVLMVAFPLQRTLLQLREQTLVQRAVLDELNKVIPRESIFQQDIQVQSDLVRVRVVAVLPEGFPESTRRQLEQIIAAKSNRSAKVLVFDVATRDEVERMGGLLASRTEPKVESIEELRMKLWTRVEPAIRAAWPHAAAPLVDFSIGLLPGAAGLAVHIAYLSEKELGELGEQAVQQNVRDRLSSPGSRVSFERVSPSYDLEFAGNSSQLSRTARAELDKAAATLLRFPNLRCRLNYRGADGKDISPLEQRRLDSVRAFLTAQKKISAERLEQAAGDSPANRLRAELRVPASR
jgi:uncharacterized hydrophobic protein (TIGR00271 family)